MAKISIPLSTPLKEGFTTDKALVKLALATLSWTWYISKKSLYKKTPHKTLDTFMIQADYPIGVTKYESGFLYRYPGDVDYLYFSETDFIALTKARDTGIDTNGVAVYEACRIYSRSANDEDLAPVIALDKHGLIPKEWQTAPTKLFRGIVVPKSTLKKIKDVGSVQLKALTFCSSWTTRKQIAADFIEYETGLVVQKKIAATDILVYIPALLKSFKLPLSAWDFDDEGEVIVKNTVETLTIRSDEVVKITKESTS